MPSDHSYREPYIGSTERVTEDDALRKIITASLAAHGVLGELRGGEDEHVEVSRAVLMLWRRAAALLGDGTRAVMSAESTLCLIQCADLLRMDKEHVLALLDAGQLCAQGSGDARQVRVMDLLVYAHRRERACREALDELTRLTDLFGGYDDL